MDHSIFYDPLVRKIVLLISAPSVAGLTIEEQYKTIFLLLLCKGILSLEVAGE